MVTTMTVNGSFCAQRSSMLNISDSIKSLIQQVTINKTLNVVSKKIQSAFLPKHISTPTYHNVDYKIRNMNNCYQVGEEISFAFAASILVSFGLFRFL